MKSKIGIKIIAVLIGITALSIGILVTNHQKQQKQSASQSAIEQAAPISNAENSNASNATAEENLPLEANAPVNSKSQNAQWGLLKLFGVIAVVGLAIFLLIISAMWIVVKMVELLEWAGKDTQNSTGAIIGLAVLLGLLLAASFLPRSQILIFRSWSVAGDIRENGFLYDTVFGDAPSGYDVDVRGRVTALRLRDKNLQSLEQINGIENLTVLRKLEISDSPLAGTFDASAFLELEELHLQNTGIQRIVGLENLPKLRRLNLKNSAVEEISSIGTARTVDLSGTKITDVSVLTDAPFIDGLMLGEMDLSQIEGFYRLPPLKVLSLHKSKPIDLELISRLVSVETLILDGTDVSDVSPLHRLTGFKGLSIVETNVQELDDLRYTDLAVLFTDNPNFTAEKLKLVFNREIVVWQGSLLNYSWIPAESWRRGKLIAAVLLAVSVLLLLPLPQSWRRRWTMKVRSVAFFMLPGTFLVLGLWLLASVDVPISYGQEARTNFAGLMTWCAAIVGLLWLILMPLLMLLLDTKKLGQSALSAPAEMFSWLFSWLRWLFFYSPIFLFIGFTFWHFENTRNAGAFFLLLLSGLYILLPFFGLILILLTFTYTKGESRRTAIYKLWIPEIGIILSWSIAAAIYIYIALRPEFLTNIPTKMFVVAVFGIPFLVSFLLVLEMIQSAFIWSGKRREVANVLSGHGTGEIVLEVAFRQKSFEFPFASFFKILWQSVLPSFGGEQQFLVVNARTVGQATSVRVTPETQKTVRGVVVVLSQQDLLRSKQWEFESLRDWLREIYRQTWSPIWIVGDWIGELITVAPSVKDKLDTLDALNPFISGVENLTAPTGTVFTDKPPDNIADSLYFNRIVDRDELGALGLPDVLQYATTPAAMLLRGVFGQANLANRLDTIVRVVETSIAIVSLVLRAEYQSDKAQSNETNDNIEKTIKTFFEKTSPTFLDWVEFFDGLTKQSETSFSRKIVGHLNAPAIAESLELRAMVEAIGGASAVSQVKLKIKKIKETLTLLVSARNVITAHGAANERAAPELYRAVLLVALDFLAAIPWQSFALCARQADNETIVFQNILPEITRDAEAQKNGTGVFVRFSKDDETSKFAAAADYFKVDEATRSLAVFAGANHFIEPVSGLNIAFDEVN